VYINKDNFNGEVTMNKLFKQKEIEKTAGSAMILLDKDSTQWVRLIISEFLSEYPMMQNLIVGIVWKKKDFNKGYAIGALQLQNNGMVPIIIKDWKCYPLDIISMGGQFIPLTPDTIQDMMTNASPFKGVAAATPKSNLSIFGDRPQFSPVQFNSVGMQDGSVEVRDAVKVASFIDQITTVDKQSIKDIFTEIQNSNLLESFEQNGTASVLVKLAEKDYVSPEKEIEAYLRDLKIDRQYEFEDADGNRFVKQANSKIDYTWTTDISDVTTKFPMLAAEDNTQPIVIAEESYDTVKEAAVGDEGYFSANGENTDVITILAINKIDEPTVKIASFNYFDRPGSLILLEDGSWCDSPETYKTAESNFDLKGTEPELGDWGVFVIPESNVATRPFSIKSIIKTAGDQMVYDVETHDGFTPMTYRLNKTERKDFSKEAGYITHVPKNAVYIKLGHLLELPSLTKLVNEAVKLANDTIEHKLLIEGVTPLMTKVSFMITDKVTDITPVDNHLNTYYVPSTAEFRIPVIQKVASTKLKETNYMGRDSAGLYFLKGDSIEKWAQAHEAHSLSKDDAIWALLQLGASNKDVEKLASLNDGQYAQITNHLSVPVSIEAFENEVMREYEKISADVEDIKLSLIKEAAVINDQASVDAILSLGLMKKFNIMEYLQLIPNYEMVMSELARLLLLARLGSNQLPDMPIKIAMEAMATVAYMLKRLEATVKTNG
jgi:hypothetical protein